MPKVYFISDNHFSDYDDPKDVIHVFKRKYPNLAAMNLDMIKKWNRTVQPEDYIFSIGDFAWTREEFQKYANRLNGKKHFIMGNHDLQGDLQYFKDAEYFSAFSPIMAFFSYNKRDFLLVHDPHDVPKWWHGWVIHGHHHDVYGDKYEPTYPFINGKRKNINVACERVNYAPVDLDWIIDLDIDTIEWMDTVDSKTIIKNHN